MRRPLALPMCVCALIAGCGGAAAHHPATSNPPNKTTTTDPTAQVEGAVREAVVVNFSLSNWVLWHDSLPAWATRSTGGPALVALRTAAASRQRQHLQIRGISPHLDVLSIALAPSYAEATATVKETGELREYSKGKPTGKPSRVNEKYRLNLHRAGSVLRFVVWKVEAT
jgi:hypothetical protein